MNGLGTSNQILVKILVLLSTDELLAIVNIAYIFKKIIYFDINTEEYCFIWTMFHQCLINNMALSANTRCLTLIKL